MKLGPRNTRVVAVAITAVLVVVLGGGLLLQVTKSPHVGLPSGSGSASPTGKQAASVSASPSKTTVVWYIGFGTGSQPNQLKAAEDFRDAYNATNTDNIDLEFQFISGGNATDTLWTQIDAGKGPDILGPVGIQTNAQYSSYWLGLDDLIAKNRTDLSSYPPALLKTFKDSAGQYEGLPYIEYPAFIFYNKDVFKAAGLPDLPTEVGQKYMGQDWTWDELATVAEKLTVDTSGRKSTDPGFNPAKIQDYGFDTQWVNDLRRLGTAWGAGSYVAADGKTAQIPPGWAQAWSWYYDAMWTSHFAPTNAERSAADMGGTTDAKVNPGATVATGRVAMDLAWAWTVGSFGPDANGDPTLSSTYKHWDMGVLPSNAGVTTDPIDTETFVINKKSKVPDASYKVMLALMADPNLVAAYGAMPVDPSLQAAYFDAAQAGVDKQFANNPITWSVLTEMVKYAASPTHQDPMPAYIKATTDDQAFYTELQSKGGLTLDAEIAKFKAILQADFKAPQ